MLGETTVYDRTPPELVVERSREARIVSTNKTKLGDEAFRALPDLRYDGVLATGYDIVDVTLCHGVGNHNDAVKAREWMRSADFCFWKQPLVELAGKTIGLVGYGRISRQVAAGFKALGMHMLYTRRRESTTEDLAAYAEGGAKGVEVPELLAEADVVSLHCPLTPSTDD